MASSSSPLPNHGLEHLPAPSLLAAETTGFDNTPFDGSPFDPLIDGLNATTPHIGWRRQALLLAAVIGCLTVFLLARVDGQQPAVASRVAQQRQRLAGAAPLRCRRRSRTTSVPSWPVSSGRAVSCCPIGVMALTPSARWISDDTRRQGLVAVRLATARAAALRDGPAPEVRRTAARSRCDPGARLRGARLGVLADDGAGAGVLPHRRGRRAGAARRAQPAVRTDRRWRRPRTCC